MGKAAELEEQLERVHLSLSSSNEQLRTVQENSDFKMEEMRND